jgi:hypothetical protein
MKRVCILLIVSMLTFTGCTPDIRKAKAAERQALAQEQQVQELRQINRTLTRLVDAQARQ